MDRGRIVASLFCLGLIVVACQTGGPAATATSSTPAGPGPSDPSTATLAPSLTADPSPSSNAWPPVGSAPTPTSTVPALLVHERWGDTGSSFARLTILADGSVVALRWIEPTLSEARVVRRLGQIGLAFVRDEIARVGLFERSQSRKMITNPACCGAGDALTYRTEGRTVTVSRLLAPLDAYAPSAAWDRFDALVSDLADPEQWIPETAWADPTWAPFHAARYCLGITRRSDSSDIPVLKATEIDWPDGLRTLDSFGQPTWADATNRFGTVSADTAYALAASISERFVNVGFAPDRWVAPGAWSAVALADGGTFMSPGIEDGQFTAWLHLVPMASDIPACTATMAGVDSP